MSRSIRYSLLLATLILPARLISQNLPPEIVITKVAENIDELYVNDYVSIFAFRGQEGTLLIDSGFEENVRQVEEQLKELGGERIRYLINTHSDGDHVGGNPALGKNATILASSVCRRKLSEEEGFPEEGLPDITFSDSLEIHFNNKSIKCIALPGGHSLEDIIVYFPGSNLLVIGDIIVPESFPFVRVHQGAHVDQLVRNIDWIISRFPADVTILTSHGRNYTIDDVKRYREMLTETRAVVEEGLEAGKSAEDMKAEGILAAWESWNNKRHTWINTDLWIDTICLDHTE